MRERRMLLGKRPRAPIRRTTSMTEFSAADLAAEEIGDASRRQRDRRETAKRPPRSIQMKSANDLAAMLETAQFLRACGLCKRRLGPGLDAFIYRGEIAFCSLECRQDHLMNQQEQEEKCSLSSKIPDAPLLTAGSEATASNETVAAA